MKTWRPKASTGKSSRKSKSRFKSGDVTITVDYGYDLHKIVIAGSTWDRIRKGKTIEIRGQGFYWDGKRDRDCWSFNGAEKGAVQFSTDIGGQIYEGNLRDDNVWVEVNGEEVKPDGNLMRSPEIGAALLRAYEATEYRVPDEGFALRIGVRCPEIVALHLARRVTSSVFITAWNPGSRRLDGAANQRRNVMLADDIKALGLACVDGEGVGTDGWRESSYLVIGATREQGQTLAYTYGQNAFLFVDSGGVPQLVTVDKGEDVTEMTVLPNGHIAVAGFEPPPPDASRDELDLIPHDDEEAAFQYFSSLESPEELDAVGVVLIEGESPMNDSCYALLDRSPATANLAAASRGLSYRFVVD